MNLTQLSMTELASLLQTRKISAMEAAEAYLAQIREKDGEIGAYLTVTEKIALQQAQKTDRQRAAGEELPPFAGIPAAVKDNICTKGIRTTCASRILENFVPPYDAAVVERLLENGIAILGKTNLDEFGMGSTTENSAFQITHNPCAPDRVPGGSSGGSAAAVAAGMAPFALGSDTGGSVRLPASHCGVVGVKPTYGAVSRWGLVAFASSLEQVGVLARTVPDAAAVLNMIVGYDRRDATSRRSPGMDFSQIGQDAKGLRIAMPRELFGAEISAPVREAVERAASVLERCGASAEFVDMPSLRYALPAYYMISSAESSSNLARFDGVRYGRRAAGYTDMDSLYERSRGEGFGREVKRRLLLGSFVLSAGYYDGYYRNALRAREKIRREFAAVLEQYDVILSPVSPDTAPRIGKRDPDPVRQYQEDLCTVPANLAGLPAVSVPCGRGPDGLPIGAQLVGKPFSEPLLLRAAAVLEQEVRG